MLDNVEKLKILADMSSDTAAEILREAIKHIKAVEESLKVCSADRLGMKASLDSAARIIIEKDAEITRLEEAVKEACKCLKELQQN